MSKFLSVAIQAAHAAGAIQQYYRGTELEIDTKSSHIDLVTKVDKLCESRIREIIASHYPDHVVLGEEQGQEGEADYRWIVDPLDGTLNYAHGFPYYCVSIALEHRSEIILGVVFDSTRNELYTAVKGEGAFCNGAPLKVSSETTFSKAMLATGFSYDAVELQKNLELFAKVHPQVRAIRRPGAAALDMAYIARGHLDAFWELTLNPWDVAAGWLLVQEAGGTVTGSQGEPYRLGKQIVLASNGHLHAKLVHALGLGETLA
ncbi:MAG: inositol monophosphatase [Trueperaceae bacterium]|nr:inositol monophosphatase [Trueperaceae bacterium]